MRYDRATNETVGPGRTPGLLFITWADNCSRSDALAKLLGGVSKMVYAESLGSRPLTVWLKYLVQMWWTWRLLLREKPRVVMVMVPPVFICAPVYLYCRWFRAGYITDTHTAAFTMSRWKPLLFLNAWFYRRALTNIVTNAHLAEQVAAWKAPHVVIGDLPVSFEKVKPFPINGRFTITVICSFNPDEPLDEIWQAARQLDGIDFYVTGKLKDAPPRLLEQKPQNVQLTDYLALDLYAGLLQASHAVMVLTTRDHTMQRGAYEAMALGTPIITSDWRLLRETFSKGAVFVDNSPEDIVKAVRKLQSAWPEYKAAVQAHRQARLEVWQANERTLHAAIAAKD
jgi:glycosyltransferase involved in cell wall biosynthesis